MSKNRLKLHEVLTTVLGSGNVYFQPPSSVCLKYPAIVYTFGSMKNVHADDLICFQQIFYEVTVIDTDPECEIAGRISRLPRCRFNRHFVSDNLYHDVFEIYF